MENAVSSSRQKDSSIRVKGTLLRVALNMNSRPSVITGREILCTSQSKGSEPGDSTTSAPPRKELILSLIASKIVIGIGLEPPQDMLLQHYTLPRLINAIREKV